MSHWYSQYPGSGATPQSASNTKREANDSSDVDVKTDTSFPYMQHQVERGSRGNVDLEPPQPLEHPDQDATKWNVENAGGANVNSQQIRGDMRESSEKLADGAMTSGVKK
eukprot:GEZU01025476.1.p3 GENE.GEZU01025476.1~~GEZU01025476.1.p3  ORF type:complete len:110 (-),score=29.72 GEZU01025476.1:180-509(-)